MNIHPPLPETAPSAPAARLRTDKSPDKIKSTEPQIHASNGTDPQTRGEKRPYPEAGQSDPTETSTEPKSKLRRTDSASNLGSVNKALVLKESLLDACKGGNLEAVKAWYAEGMDLCAELTPGMSALSWACTYGRADVVAYMLRLPGMDDTVAIDQGSFNAEPSVDPRRRLEVLKMLVNAGASRRANADQKFTVLNRAIEANLQEIVAYLLSLPEMCDHAVLNHHSKEGHILLLNAIKDGRLDIVKLLMSVGANPLLSNDQGDNALHIASKHRDVTLVSALLERPGMSEDSVLNSPNREGFTPLLHACSENNLENAMVLIRNGADEKAKTNDGDTGVHLASRKGYTEIVRLIFETSNNRNDTNDRNLTVDPDWDKENGSMFETPNKQGFTPFMLACLGGHVEVVRCLIDGGLGGGYSHVASALTLALQTNQVGCVSIILNLPGINVTKLVNTPVTLSARRGYPLHFACEQGHLDAVKSLVEAGASLTASNSDGHTILTAAISSSGREIVEYLLSSGHIDVPALVNQPGYSGIPIQVALYKNDLSIFKLLVAHGARFDQKFFANDSLNMPVPIMAERRTGFGTPNWQFMVSFLDIAIKHKSYGIAAFLIEKGLSVAVADPVLAIPYATPTDPEGIDIMNHTALLINPLTAPANGLTNSLLSLEPAQWLTQLVSHQIATMPAAKGWQRALHTQGVSAFIIRELRHHATYIPSISRALAGSGRRSTQAQQQYIVALLLLGSTHRLSGQTPFSGKGFAADVEARFNHMFSLQRAAIEQSAKAVLMNTQNTQFSRLLELCADCVTIHGTINRLALSSLLTDKIGMFAPTADRIILVFEEAVKLARQRGEVGAHLAATFKECLQQKQNEKAAPPGFRAGQDALPNEESRRQFVEIVFRQWRVVCLANDVQVPQ